MGMSEFALNFKYAFRPNKPMLVARLAKTVFKSSFFNKIPLRYVDFAIDFECNLKCQHCFATVLRQDGRRRMEPADYARVAEECMELGTVNFSFQGGEPLLFKKLPDIVKACKPYKNVISVTTNGTLLNEKNIAELKKIGVDILTVSLDSSIAGEHDEFRGVPGVFDKTIAGINLALRRGFNVSLGTVVTHQSLHSKGITGIIEMAKERKLILNLILPVPAGRWIDNNDMVLTGDDLDFIYKLTKNSPYIRTDFQANLGPYGCGAGKEILYLTPYGDVLVCPFLHITFGNIFEDSIKTIRERALQVPQLAVYHDKCLASTDKEFIDKYLSKTFNASKLPINYAEVFK